jgi:hypothetical protein
MEKYPVHLLGIICWLPQHNPSRKRFEPNKYFVALIKFTSNFCSPDYEAIISYSPYKARDFQGDCFEARLHFPGILKNQEEKIKQLSRNSELLILDSYIVIAVCKRIKVPVPPSGYLDEEWHN